MVIKLWDIFNADTRGVIHTRDHGYYAQMDRNTIILYFEHSFHLFIFIFLFWELAELLMDHRPHGAHTCHKIRDFRYDIPIRHSYWFGSNEPTYLKALKWITQYLMFVNITHFKNEYSWQHYI